MNHRTRAALAAMWTALAGCEASKDAGAQAQREAGALAERTRAGAADMAEAAQREAGVLAERTRDEAARLAAVAGERGTEAAKAAADSSVAAARTTADWATQKWREGRLTETAQGWLRRGAEASRGGIEAVLQRGQQAAPVAAEIGAALGAAIDSDTMFEPIYQQVGEGVSAEADAAIQGMTRVEPIDGLQVGFKELTSLDLGHRVSEHAYLVMWRQDDRLVGFVFRSRRDIALAELITLAPRLVGLVRSVL
jgi:hypothetical protein